MSNWNPNYVAYATVQGRTPDAQLAHDREGHETGNALPFMLWIFETPALCSRASVGASG